MSVSGGSFTFMLLRGLSGRKALARKLSGSRNGVEGPQTMPSYFPRGTVAM
jgi:hypothetical protein